MPLSITYPQVSQNCKTAGKICVFIGSWASIIGFIALYLIEVGKWPNNPLQGLTEIPILTHLTVLASVGALLFQFGIIIFLIHLFLDYFETQLTPEDNTQEAR